MTDLRPIVALAPVLGLAVGCFLHVAATRLVHGRGPYPPLAVGALAGVAATLAITLAACVTGGVPVGDTLALAAMNGVAAFAFAFCYFNFVNLTIASLRIRILEELAEARGRMPRATLLDRYGSGNVAGIRLERLVRSGHLVERNGRLHTGRLQFLLVARIFDGLRRVIFGSARTAAPRRSPEPAPPADGTAL
jgi:hypothetical protein